MFACARTRNLTAFLWSKSVMLGVASSPLIYASSGAMSGGTPPSHRAQRFAANVVRLEHLRSSRSIVMLPMKQVSNCGTNGADVIEKR